MKEFEFLNIINKTLDDTSYLGDDCAYLEGLGLYVTHDSLVQDVHFSLQTTSAFDLGMKSVAVNLSDLAAAGATPLYLTISLSLPFSIGGEFVEGFYKGINESCLKYGVKVVGGDLTGSDKVFVSVCAIGKKTSKTNVSRKFAKVGDVVVVTGEHGNSAGGLRLLQNAFKTPSNLIEKHLKPIPQLEKSALLMNAGDDDFAMMDTSDGLGDALYKIAKESGVTLEIDFAKIPVSKDLKEAFPVDCKDLVIWGGEDFELLACVKKEVFEKLDKTKFFEIGRVVEKSEKASVIIKDGAHENVINEETFMKNSFNHFEE